MIIVDVGAAHLSVTPLCEAPKNMLLDASLRHEYAYVHTPQGYLLVPAIVSYEDLDPEALDSRPCAVASWSHERVT